MPIYRHRILIECTLDHELTLDESREHPRSLGALVTKAGVPNAAGLGAKPYRC